jgi:hypothetical protein
MGAFICNKNLYQQIYQHFHLLPPVYKMLSVVEAALNTQENEAVAPLHQ